MGYYYHSIACDSEVEIEFYFLDMAWKVNRKFRKCFEEVDVEGLKELENFLWMTWGGYEPEDKKILKRKLLRSMPVTGNYETNMALCC